MAYQPGSSNAFVKSEPTEGAVPSPHASLNTNSNATWDELLKRTEEDPFSETAWDALLDCAEESGDNEKIKMAYDALLQKYPNIVSVVPPAIPTACHKFAIETYLVYSRQSKSHILITSS